MGGPFVCGHPRPPHPATGQLRGSDGRTPTQASWLGRCREIQQKSSLRHDRRSHQCDAVSCKRLQVRRSSAKIMRHGGKLNSNKGPWWARLNPQEQQPFKLYSRKGRPTRKMGKVRETSLVGERARKKILLPAPARPSGTPSELVMTGRGPEPTVSLFSVGEPTGFACKIPGCKEARQASQGMVKVGTGLDLGESVDGVR